ncbi:MAG: hypothetical protein ACLQBA_26355 [Candidatus Binataceae bacterium]
MKSAAIKHFVQRSIVGGGRKLHGQRVRRAGYVVGISTMLPAARALAAVAPGDREVFPWTPVIMALHTSIQGQDAHWLTIAILMGSAVLMLLTRRGTAVRKLSALLLGGSAALVMFELQYAFLPLLPGISGP